MTSTPLARKLWPWLAIALVVIVLDQITKALIVARFEYGDSVYVTSFFNVVRVHNTGAAFSFLASESGWQRWFFIVLGIAASVFMVWLLRNPSTTRVGAWALALVMGGALGNVIDRFQHGHVVDFIQVHWGAQYYFPSFNVADSAITVGAFLLILDEVLRLRRAKRAQVS